MKTLEALCPKQKINAAPYPGFQGASDCGQKELIRGARGRRGGERGQGGKGRRRRAWTVRCQQGKDSQRSRLPCKAGIHLPAGEGFTEQASLLATFLFLQTTGFASRVYTLAFSITGARYLI